MFYNYINDSKEGMAMINLIKNNNINVSILQYDFDIYKKIAETYSEPLK